MCWARETTAHYDISCVSIVLDICVVYSINPTCPKAGIYISQDCFEFHSHHPSSTKGCLRLTQHARSLIWLVSLSFVFFVFLSLTNFAWLAYAFFVLPTLFFVFLFLINFAWLAYAFFVLPTHSNEATVLSDHKCTLIIKPCQVLQMCRIFESESRSAFCLLTCFYKFLFRLSETYFPTLQFLTHPLHLAKRYVFLFSFLTFSFSFAFFLELSNTLILLEAVSLAGEGMKR